jgi:hypothetical protein
MLNRNQYDEIMNELASLDKWHSLIMFQLPKNKQGNFDKSAQVTVDIEKVLLWMRVLGDIELAIRKKVVEFTPSVSKPIGTPIIKTEPRAEPYKNKSKKKYF